MTSLAAAIIAVLFLAPLILWRTLSPAFRHPKSNNMQHSDAQASSHEDFDNDLRSESHPHKHFERLDIDSIAVNMSSAYGTGPSAALPAYGSLPSPSVQVNTPSIDVLEEQVRMAGHSCHEEESLTVREPATEQGSWSEDFSEIGAWCGGQ